MACSRFRFALLSLLLVGTMNLVGQTALPQNGVESREKDPVLRADGNELFFTRPDHASNQGKDNAADVWIRARNADGSWGRALNPGSPVNSFAHDRVLALGPDGIRLVVLRSGFSRYIDLLERGERNWRIVQSWPLPEGVYPRLDATFDLNGQRLIYSAYGSNGTLDLYERTALANGKWSPARPLARLNGGGDSTAPQVAADGRTLYFRQNDRWWKQTDRDRAAVATNLPARIRQFAAPMNGESVAIVVYDDLGGEERLLTQPLPAKDLPPTARATRGYLASALAPGTTTTTIRLTNGRELPVYPDALRRYIVFLRDGEQQVIDQDNATMGGVSSPAADAYASRSAVADNAQDRLRLQQGIATREAALRQLDAERRRYDLAIPKTSDPELEALRERHRQFAGVGDSIPPGKKSVRDKYARDLAELERMKAKFRKQQEDKLRQRSGRRGHEWTARGEEPTAKAANPNAPATQQRVAIPSIADSYTPPPGPEELRALAEQRRLDSLRLSARVRTDLYPDRQPAAYEREPWENDVRSDLPRTTPLSSAEAARLDAEYQRKQDELSALRAQLQRLNETEPAPTAAAPPAYSTPNPQWSAKGQPATYGNTPAAPVPATPPRTTTLSTGRPGISAGISFIPNTAYPDGAGYTGLDQLVMQLKNATVPLELRVHTSVEMDRRAAQLLSEERAVSIRDYLIEQRVPSRMFTVVGFGNNLTGNGGERVEMIR